ncbi:MAG TPA: hypothetical protein VF549_11900 [Solirubrobacteraceae bacterium]
MRRFVLAPLLALLTGTLVVLAAISIRGAFDTDLTALVYAVLLVAGAAITWAASSSLVRGRVPVPRAWTALPPWVRRTAALVVGGIVAAGALAAAALAAFGLAALGDRPDPSVPDGDPCCTYPDTWGEIIGPAALGVVLAVATAGLLVAAARAMEFALVGRGRPAGPLAQALIAFGLLVAIGFPAWIVVEGWLRGDYP